MVYLGLDDSSLQNLRVWGFGVVVLQGTRRFLFPTGWSPLLHCYVDLLKGLVSVTFQFCSVPQTCLTLSDPMDCSIPGLLVHHQLPEFTQAHVHWVGNAIQPFHPLSSPSLAFNLSQHQGLFQWVSSSHQVAKLLELQLQHQSFQWMNIQGWFPLGLTGLISLLSKGFSA